jgi:hypothetical protein
MGPLNSASPSLPTDMAVSPLPANIAQAPSNGRPAIGFYSFSPRAAGVGEQQFDRIGIDRVGPSSTLWASTRQQDDGSWRTEITVPYGRQIGGHDGMTGADRYTTLSYASKQQPTKNAEGRLFVSGVEISGDLLERQLAKLSLPLPDWRSHAAGGGGE